jgi:hypothetical protein
MYFVMTRARKEHVAHATVGVVALCVLLLMSLFETYNMIHTFLLMQLVFYSPLLSKVENESEKQSIES